MKMELNAAAPGSAKQSQMWLKLDGWTQNNNITIQISKQYLQFLPEKLETESRSGFKLHILLKVIFGTAWASATYHDNSWGNEESIQAIEQNTT